MSTEPRYELEIEPLLRVFYEGTLYRDGSYRTLVFGFTKSGLVKRARRVAIRAEKVRPERVVL